MWALFVEVFLVFWAICSRGLDTPQANARNLVLRAACSEVGVAESLGTFYTLEVRHPSILRVFFQLDVG